MKRERRGAFDAHFVNDLTLCPTEQVELTQTLRLLHLSTGSLPLRVDVNGAGAVEPVHLGSFSSIQCDKESQGAVQSSRICH